jgi:hypothetical protein
MGRIAKFDILGLRDFLSETRTEKEIAKKIGCKPEKVYGKLLSIKLNDLNIFVSKLSGSLEGENIYFVRPKISLLSSLIIKPRHWHYTISSEERVPYLRIQFLPQVNFKKLTIVPISDVHYGQEAWNEKEFVEYVKWISVNDNVFCFLNGDIFENALADSPGGAIFDQKIRPRRQSLTFIELIYPVLHKILWTIPGNHEGRTLKRADVDPLFWFCQMFDIPYFDQPVYVDINWQKHNFSLFCQHGASGSRTEGGKLNAAARPLMWTDFTMFYVMGHVHDDIVSPSMRRCRIVKQAKKGRVKEFLLVDREQYIIVVPGWMEYWGTYAARAGYHPTSQGTVAIHLRNSGSYEASS